MHIMRASIPISSIPRVSPPMNSKGVTVGVVSIAVGVRRLGPCRHVWYTNADKRTQLTRVVLISAIARY